MLHNNITTYVILGLYCTIMIYQKYNSVQPLQYVCNNKNQNAHAYITTQYTIQATTTSPLTS